MAGQPTKLTSMLWFTEQLQEVLNNALRYYASIIMPS